MKRTMRPLLLIVCLLLFVQPVSARAIWKTSDATVTEEPPMKAPVSDAPIECIAVPEDAEPIRTVKCDVWIEPPNKPIQYEAVPLSNDLQDYIYLVCDTYFVPVELVFAVIEAESNFTDGIVSATDDYGLMQLNVCCHDYLRQNLGVNNILDPYQNVHSGIFILSQKLNIAKGNVQLALICYNLGDFGGINAWESGTKSTFYSEKVMGLYYSYVDKLNGIE